MARTLENPVSNPTYLEYFGMSQPPFAPLPGPSPMFLSEQYSLLMAHLSSATEQTDCMMVICGADGSGKTTLLNRYISSLSKDVSFATFDDTCADGTEFYCVLLRQLGFLDISGSLNELRHIAKEFLIHRGKDDDPVLLIIDNAHLVKPAVYEQLRWIAETKVDGRRVMSIVLAGNSDLPRIMDSPAMQSIQFSSRINFSIRVYTEEETEDYVRHRLRLAGGIDAAKFSNEARPLIYQYTGGVPSSINVLCNEVLSEAHARETRVISANLVRSVAHDHQITPPAQLPKNKRRRKTDSNIKLVVPEQRKEARITAREVPPKGETDTPTSEAPEIEVKDLLDQISRLSERTGEFKAERQQTLLAIAARDEEISELKEQLAEIKSERMQAFSDIGAREKEIGELKDQLAEFESDKVQALSDIGARDEEISSLKEQLAEFQSDKVQALSDIGARDEQIGELREQLTEFESDKVQALSDIGARDEEIGELKERLIEFESAKTQALSDVGARDEQIGELREQLTEFASDKTQALSDLGARDEEIDDLRERLTEFESAKTQALSDIGARDEEIGELREQLAGFESEKMQAFLDIDAREKEISELGEHLAEIESDKTQALSDIGARDEEIHELREQLAEFGSERTRALSDIGTRGEEINKLRAQIDELRSERKQVLSDVDARDSEIVELHKLVATQTKQAETLACAVEDKADEISQLKKDLAESAKALKTSEKTSSEHAAELGKEQGAKEHANERIAKAEERIDELDRMRSELQSSVSDLTRDLRKANEGASRSDVLEQKIATFKEEIRNKASELVERDKLLGDLERSLRESQRECESLRGSADALTELEASATDKDARIADLETELASLVQGETRTQAQLQDGQTPSGSSKSRPKSKRQPERGATSKDLASPIAILEVFRGGKIVQVLEIADGPSRIMIGRNDDCELCLDSKFVSRHHALIFCVAERVYIEDLNSFNGTIVNSKTIARCDLNPDDHILIGDFQIRPRQV